MKNRISPGRNEICLLVFLLSSDILLYAHIIETKLGFLEGVTMEARNKKLFYAYYGIPYAKPPVGKLRFEPPVIPDPWIGILNATKPTEPCSQVNDNEGRRYKGVEDCLYAHVYTPVNLKPGSNVPVIFYINGGVFRYGDAYERGPEFMLSRDVVLVVMNYRIGVLGLLSTGDTVIPGNLALKDQMLAMKWTKENIYEFGGDPDQVTLMGHSAGATSINLHAFNPQSEQYFHQMILLSGFAISPQSFWDGATARGVARAVAARVNCPIDSSEELKVCLQTKSDQELVMAGEQIRVWNNLEPFAQFRPVIEDKAVKNAFLTKNPLNASYILPSKPLLVGMARDEAAAYVGSYYHHPNADVLNVDTKLLLPVLGFYDWTSKPNEVNFITRILKTRFFGEENVNNETDVTDIALSKMLTGLLHGHALIDVVQKYKGLTYVYLLDYRYVGGYVLSKGGRDDRYLGVAHGIELPILFREPSITGIAEEDFAFGDEMITRFINFAYTGNPNEPYPINNDVFGAWSPVSSSRIEFLRMKRGGGMEKDYFVERYNFYRKLPLFSQYQ